MYSPLDKDKAFAAGFLWDDYEAPSPQVDQIIRAIELPDNIRDVSDDIFDAAIECEVTGKLFRITTKELKFYRRLHLPLPRRWPDQRHFDRFLRRNPRKFWERKCGKCSKAMWTTFSPASPEKVACEECYLGAMY